MRRRLLARARREDSGFTLVELMVYSIILIIVMGIAANLFVRVLYTTRDVKDMAYANNTVQTVYRQLEMEVRNASWVKIADGGNVIVMRTRVATATNFNNPYCVGYYFDAASNELRRTQATNGTQTAAILNATSTTQRQSASSTWPRALKNFSAVGATRVFGPADAVIDKSKTVELNMQAVTGNGHKPVKFSKNVSLRTQSDLGTAGCS